MRFAVIGSNVKKSLSPKLNNWIYNKLNLRHTYSSIQASDIYIKKIFQMINTGEINGINVTAPFKTKIINNVQKIDFLANEIGAINCINFDQGILKGYNTDYYGFSHLIELHKINLSNNSVLVLGAGGVSRAVCTYLKHNNVSYSIYNRTSDKIIIDNNNRQSIVDINKLIGFDIVINCLSNNRDCYKMIEDCVLTSSYPKVFIDLNYNTKKLFNTNHYSNRYIDGIYMLIFQAIRSNEIWINNSLPLNIDYVKLYEFLLDK